MDDFAFDGLSNSDYENECLSYFNDYSSSYYQLDLYTGGKTEENRDTAESEEPSTESQECRIEEAHRQGLFTYEARASNKIEVVSSQVRREYVSSKKGEKGETSDLTANSKNIIKKTLEEASNGRSLNFAQTQLIDEFNRSPSNLAAFRKLYGIEQHQSGRIVDRKGSDRIRRLSLDKASGSWIAQQMLRSKQQFSSKLVGLKHLESIRRLSIAPEFFSKWKVG